MKLTEEKINSFKTTIAGRLVYYFLPIRKKIISNNIDIVYKDISKKNKKRLMLAFYSHIALMLKEIIFFNCLKNKIQVEVQGLEHLEKALERGKGVLALSGHLGNWEITCPIAFPKIKFLKDQVNYIRKPLKPSFINRTMMARYHKAFLKVINHKNGIKKTVKALGNNEIIFFAFDQHISLRKGISVPFFSKQAGTYDTLAYLANTRESPVLPIYAYREAKRKHIIKIEKEISVIQHDNFEQEIYLNTLNYNRVLEQLILEHPEQWFCWMHRRWKIKD